MEEMDNQIEQATSMLSKNRKVLLSVLAGVVIVGALFLLIPRKQNTAVKDLNLDSQLKQKKVTQFLSSTKKGSSAVGVISQTTGVNSQFVGDYYLDSDKNLHIVKENGEDTILASNVGPNSGFKLDIAHERLFYRSGMDGTVVNLKTGEKKTTEGLLNAWFTKDYTLFSVMKDDKDYLMLGDSPTPLLEGSCFVINVLKDNTIAVLDVDPELDSPMPGYLTYDAKQDATNMNLVKIDLANVSKSYSPIVLANSDRGSVNIAGNIIYQDNNNKTKINNGERELTVDIPINISTLSQVGGTNTALFAEVSRADNRVNIKSLNLDNAKVTTLNEYYFKDSIYTVPSSVPDVLKEKLATPVSKVTFDNNSKSYLLSIGDNLISLPASSDPTTGVSYKTNILGEIASNFNIRSVKTNNTTSTVSDVSNSSESSKVLGEESSQIPTDCIAYVKQITKETSEQEARDKLDQALKCFGGYVDTVIQSKDIRTMPTLSADKKTLETMGASPDIIDSLIKLVAQGKSFQIAKLASQFNAKDKLPFRAISTVKFNREKTNFGLADVYNDNLKVNNFFDNRLEFNLITYNRGTRVDYISSNTNVNVAFAAVGDPSTCNIGSGLCYGGDGTVWDVNDPTIQYSERYCNAHIKPEFETETFAWNMPEAIEWVCDPNAPTVAEEAKSNPETPADPNPTNPSAPTPVVPPSTATPTNPTNSSQSGPNV